MKQRGFTLIELIIVIVITGIMAATITIFMKPVIDGYFSTRNRAALADIADTSLRRIGRDVQSAVPNSIRLPNNQCFEIVPTSMGGRYRMAPDTVNDIAGCAPSSNCSAPLDSAQPVTKFDVLSQLPSTPAVNDWVIISNQNTNDVYTGSSASQISSSPTAPSRATDGTLRITINSKQYQSGYDQGRFVIVPNNGGGPTVFYICSGADGTVNTSGNGKGTLYRVTRAFNSTYPTSCPSLSGAATEVILATNVKSCDFIYNSNQGATQQSGFLWMQLGLTTDNENASLAYGVHVDNVP